MCSLVFYISFWSINETNIWATTLYEIVVSELDNQDSNYSFNLLKFNGTFLYKLEKIKSENVLYP